MNTLIIKPSTQSLFTRFAWKEYRMLRGFWIACFVIAAALQWLVATVLNIPGTQEQELFTVAWGAAAFYVVGAAITMFCAETEERTRDYLRLLPGNWKAIFATKTFVSLASAVALGGVLSNSGWYFAGSVWPNSQDSRFTFALFGVAILEGLVWGLLFSLWWKQPLVAAVAAIAMASLGSQFAIYLTNTSQNGFAISAYRDAVPRRLLICAAIFLVDVWLGRQWLYPKARVDRKERVADKPASVVDSMTRESRPRRKMFTRLLWQTWRESWKPILVTLLLSFALMFVVGGVSEQVLHVRDAFFVALFPPALLGALTFRADQQRDHRLFLATHSARPRWVWLARHLVWLGVLLLVACGIQLFINWAIHLELNNAIRAHVHDNWFIFTSLLGREYAANESSAWSLAWGVEQMQRESSRAVATSWCAVIAAYGVGQVCSMMLKQSLLSGFLAILFSIVIAAWSGLMLFWEMNPFWFVLPVGLAALLVTWLRMPKWILGKNHVKHWLIPALAFVLPLGLMLSWVPSTRLAQVRLDSPHYPFVDSSLELLHSASRANRAEAAETALEYERLGAQLTDYEKDLIEQFPSLRTPLMPKSLKQSAETAIELSKRPYCQFSAEQVLFGSHGAMNLRNLQNLLSADALRLQEAGDLETAFERLTAKVRIIGHTLQGQTSLIRRTIYFHQDIGGYSDAYEQILDWAQHPKQTADNLKSAIAVIQELGTSVPGPGDAIYADRDVARRIILEEEPAGRHYQLHAFLNRLPGEQERALIALDHLTLQAVNYCEAVRSLADGGLIAVRKRSSNEHVDNPSELLRFTPWDKTYAVEEIAMNGNLNLFLAANKLADTCATSFLAAQVFNGTGSLVDLLQGWVDNETRRRALMIQLALLAYRIDHDKYPENLAELTPDYLPRPIFDPFSNKPFEYHSEGLEFVLVRNEWQSSATKEVAPDTPLLWSVGNGNWQLSETVESDGPADPNEQSRIVFKFRPTDRVGHVRDNLVFPLPKYWRNDPQPDRNADPGFPEGRSPPATPKSRFFGRIAKNRPLQAIPKTATLGGFPNIDSRQ